LHNTKNTNDEGVSSRSICKKLETQDELIEQEAYTWRAPYSSGAGLSQGITENLGITVGGIDAERIVGFGYPEQPIVWNGERLQNNYKKLLEMQTDSLPLRTMDLQTAFKDSLGTGSLNQDTRNQPGKNQEFVLFSHFGESKRQRS